MIVVGTDLRTSRAAFDLCSGEPGLFPTAGIHPHDASSASEEALAEVEAMCRRPECVAVGETGLDFFKEYSPRAAQIENYYRHLDLARRLGKPIVIHCRDAHEENSRILGEFAGVQGVMHCYSMGPEELAPYLELDLHISFSGMVTYPKNDANREAAALVSEERLLVETDCPFLAPQEHRGQRNEPAWVRLVLERVAAVRGAELEALARATSANAARLFGLT